MKLKLQFTRAAMFTLPVSLLLCGCDDKKTAATDYAPVSTNRANRIAADADNSGKNIRDRNDATLTPGDQGNTPADREITQKVRATIVSGTNDYSMTAKNVKIITVDGKVTLRGPVKTDAEKTGIVAMAKTVAGDINVDDQLEVKANP